MLVGLMGTGQARPAINTVTTLITAGAGKKVAVLSLFICNPGTSDATFDVWKVPSGGSASDNNVLIRNELVPAVNQYPYPSSFRIVLEEGETLRVRSNTAQLTYTPSWMEIS